MNWCFATIWEAIVDAAPDAPAVVEGTIRRTWHDYENRAARLAGALAAAGIRAGSKVAIYAYNSAAWLEAQFAAFKLGAVPVNVNYRYAEDELVYLLDNADAEVLVFDAQFSRRVSNIHARLPQLRCLIEIDDGSGQHLDAASGLEALISGYAPRPRSVIAADSIHMVYTGGTTGLPKGVMYRQSDLSRGLMSGYDRMGLPRPDSRDTLIAAVRALQARGDAPVSIPACPLMHGTGQNGGVLVPHNMGGCVVLFRNEHFDAARLWELVARERATDLTIVGDAFARPMLAALDTALDAGTPHDLSSLKRIVSSGVMFSSAVKAGLLRHADITILDSMGASEGSMAVSVVSRASPPGATAHFAAGATTRVFAEDGREIQPGSGEIGMIATGGLIPIGYYKDPEKSAATFRMIDGRRFAFPGDHAQVAADGSLIFLGRGSNCINTGGEKVFPEEVEEALKAHSAVSDCLVVGVPDERFGERIIAVASSTDGEPLNEASVLGFLGGRIAGYKRPRRIIFAPQVRRAANGKADYVWAKTVALAALHAAEPPPVANNAVHRPADRRIDQ